MALYEVTRTDRPGIGEFVEAYVIAGGTAQARSAVEHMTGVTKSNVRAERVDLTSEIKVLSTYFDERDGSERAFDEEYAGDVSTHGSFNW